MDSLETDNLNDNSTVANSSTEPIFPPPAKPMNFWAQLAVLLGVTGGGLIVASIVSVIVFIGMTGVGAFNIEKELFNPKHINAIKTIQVISTLFTFLVPAFLFALIVHKQPSVYLGFKRKATFKQVGIVILIGVVGIAVGGLLAEVNEWIPISKSLEATFKAAEKKYADQVLLIAKMNNVVDYLSAMLIIALLPAIFEELFFRGALQQLLTQWFKMPIVAILVTSIVFSAIHLSYYGFLTRAFLGVGLGLVYYYSKNIWLPIIIHFVNNGIAVTAFYVYTLQGKSGKEVLDEKYPIWLGCLGVVLLVGLFVQFKKESYSTDASS
jgi:uncharacterized protein